MDPQPGSRPSAGALLAQTVASRLLIGWGLGFLASVLGLLASYAWDLPTGATVVTTFGALLATVAIGLGVRGLIEKVGAQGLGALRGVGVIATTPVCAGCS